MAWARMRARCSSGASTTAEHAYAIDDEELRAFRHHLNQESLAAKFGGNWSATEI